MNIRKIKKLAKKDATRWLPAVKLHDEIANKRDILTGYDEAFDAAYAKIAAKVEPAHLKEMNKLRDKLTRMEAKKTGARGLIVLAGAYLILNQTGYDKVLFEGAKKLKNDVEDALAKRKVNGRHEASAG